MEDLKLSLSDKGRQATAEKILSAFHLSQDHAKRITEVLY